MLKPIFIIAATGLSKVNSLQGDEPYAISNIVHPNYHISALVPYFSYFIISGAIHGILPLISSLKLLLKFVKVLLIYLEQPKSVNFISSLSSIKILEHLISL